MPSRIDKIRSAISGWLAPTNQVHADLVRNSDNAFRHGKLDERTRKYNPGAFSGDAAIADSQDLMHRRVRDQVRNDSVMKRAVAAYQDVIVGSGLRTFSDPVTPQPALLLKNDELNMLLEHALESDNWYERWWCDPDQFDVEGNLAGPDAEAMGMREQVSVGDTLFLKVFNARRGNIVPLQYQIIERDQLDCSKDTLGGANQNRIVNGVELNRRNQKVAYHLFDAHPGDQHQPFTLTTRSRRIPADRILHASMFTRPSALALGATWTDAIAQDMYDEDKLVTSELRSAAKASLLAVIAKLRNPNAASMGFDDGLDDTDELGNESIALGENPLAVSLYKDESVDVAEAKNRPNMDVMGFIDQLAFRKAAGLSLSYYRMSGNFTKTNYTGFRGAMILEDAHVVPIQNWYGRKISIPMRREFNALAMGMGLFKTITPSQFRRDEWIFQNLDLVGPGRALIEPERETQAELDQLRACLTTLKIVLGRRGLHWIKVLRQCKLENRLIELLQLAVDFSKGQGGQSSGNTRDRKSQDNEDAEAEALTAA